VSKLTLSFKGKMLKIFQVSEGEIVIGSDPVSQLHIDSLAVQPRHATITTKNDVSVLRNLGSAEGMLVNGAKTEEHTLKDNDQIQIGKHSLQFSFVPTANQGDDDNFKVTTKAAPKSAWLQILSGNNVGKTISLKNNMTNLGKAGVQTAVITRRGDGYFITHLEGEHTPKVDGVPIGEDSRQLEDGNVIQLGNVKMQFTLT
jgi:pSer/pThr/pTyr-binding forkhead associated (FHA) protein